MAKWRSIIKQSKQNEHRRSLYPDGYEKHLEQRSFKITLTVRGKVIVKIYKDRYNYEAWLHEYRRWMGCKRDGIESVVGEIVGGSKTRVVAI